MTDTDKFQLWLEDHGNCVTLGEICHTSYVVEYRKMFTLLRKRGINYVVKLDRKNPSNNTYTLEGREPSPVFAFEENQAVMKL